jgi:predicted RNA-binding protein (virulence factor B family)
MLELGKRQQLIIHRLTEIGAYVGEPDSPETAVLLPRKQVSAGAKAGDSVDVLLYKDSEDRMIATIHQSKLCRGQVGFLKVVQVTNIGAFLDWGLERDLFLPFKEQTKKPQEGDTVLVTMYVDKSERLCASMRIYDHMSAESPYQKGDIVNGIVYEIKPLGAFVAVDDCYFGLIPSSEVYQDFQPGERITAQVMRRRQDGKLDLRVRKKAYKQMDADAELLWKSLQDAGGFLPYHDKSDPEQIREVFGLSKAAFKRAEGHLLKAEKITIQQDGLRIREK